MLNLNKCAKNKPKPKPTLNCKNCSYVRFIVHKYHTKCSIAQNSSDNFPCYPPDNHHNSDDVYYMGGHRTATFGIHFCSFFPNSALTNISLTLTVKCLVDTANYLRGYATAWQGQCFDCHVSVDWSEFNVPFQHKYGYIRDDHVSVS